jgi:predicted Fe-Mo cluster-binding NifX family protein
MIRMIIAISATRRSIEEQIYTKFERCDYFLIVNFEKNSLYAIANKAKDRPHEIGGTVGHLISEIGVNAIITTDIGPRSFEIFKENEIKIYRAEGIIYKAINQLEVGELTEITKATVPTYSKWKKNNIIN